MQAVEASTAIFYENTSNYFFARNKVRKKIVEYPKIKDFQRAVIE